MSYFLHFWTAFGSEQVASSVELHHKTGSVPYTKLKFRRYQRPLQQRADKYELSELPLPAGIQISGQKSTHDTLKATMFRHFPVNNRNRYGIQHQGYIFLLPVKSQSILVWLNCSRPLRPVEILHPIPVRNNVLVSCGHHSWGRGLAGHREAQPELACRQQQTWRHRGGDLGQEMQSS